MAEKNSNSNSSSSIRSKRDKSDLERVRAELICSICLDLLTEPKKLNCDHSFCQSCLENHVRISPCSTPDGDTAGEEGRENGGGEGGGGKGVIECGCCREKTQLPENGVEGLKTNFKLKSLVDILSTKEREKAVQDLGKGHQKKPEHDVPNCTVEGHKSESCVFFCKKCDKLFCRFCIPEHKLHDWDNWDSVLSQCKEELRGSIQPAYEAAQRASDAVKGLEEDMTEVMQNCDSVKSKVHEYFKFLASDLQSREQTLMNMVDRYVEVKMESLQKLHGQLKSGETSLLQHIKGIETQMQEDSVKLLTDKDTVKSKMVLHRNTVQRALPRTDDVDTFIELKTEVQVPPIPTLGHIVFCQKHPRTGMVSTVRNFVETEDMKHIHLDLARPFADEAMMFPAYIQFRTKEDPLPIDEDTYEDLASALPATSSDLYQHPRRAIPLPPAPLDAPQTPIEDCDLSSQDSTYAVVTIAQQQQQQGDATNVPPGGQQTRRSRSKTVLCDEDPYDTIPALRSATLPATSSRGAHNGTVSKERLYTTRRKPDVIEPENVFELQNLDIQVSGIICTQRYGNIVVTDTKNKCIQILDKGEIISTIGSPDFEFTKPVALATDSANDLFVLDQANSTFHKFRLNGDCVFSFPTKPRKTPEKPWDIAVSPDGSVYISDWSRRRVYVYNGRSGRKIRSIKGCYRRGKKDEYVEFSRPAGIAFDLGGRLMVADRGDRCIWCINTEGDEFIKTIGDAHLQDPYGIAVAKDGKIVVSESESDCVSVFDDNGDLLHYFGGTGTENGQMCRPHHVFVDTNMRIYVADTGNKRVQIFSLLEESIYQNLVPPPSPH